MNEFFCTDSRRCLRDCFDRPSEMDTANCTDHSFINCSKFIKLVYSGLLLLGLKGHYNSKFLVTTVIPVLVIGGKKC